ncbi:dynamin family protein [Kamptonema sp. UHCC 0994]|uniref:dynamin family protein n=1 Tax=Kamptonema sp. UHCC 0994 TaxID=3031329 RepID=UPI0023B9CE87|nr:dynamin family protein [Kamptonema sp. UHCC 0994]MDF0554178.1 dynamin family protein [Kamptonema sp. UHCC 0994]
MTEILPQCQNLEVQVESILQLLHKESALRLETSAVKASLNKAISPKFEIVFAGAFSAGKSMLINALLERELLYSAEGHATATECRIEYAEPAQERVVLTFLSEAEVRAQVYLLCQQLELAADVNINQDGVIELLSEGCTTIIEQEGGESKSKRAKQANALRLLLAGYEDNRQKDYIQSKDNNRLSMEQLNFSNLEQAADYVRLGKNSAVLKKVEYYCHHNLLKDGNIIVDTPGIDAPVERDAKMAYDKIEHPETSAVVCVFKSAATGAITVEETELMTRTGDNKSIRDRVFNVFNRVDETWFNDDLRERLEFLLKEQFQKTRVYKTSGLFGFYGSQIQGKNQDILNVFYPFGKDIKSLDGVQKTPQFVDKFIQYCGKPELVNPRIFPIPSECNHCYTSNDKYLCILRSDLGFRLIDNLIQDSGIEEFRTGMTRYLTEEKRPQLFAALAEDLQPVCIKLKDHYIGECRYLAQQPIDVKAMIQQKLERLTQDLSDIGREFEKHIDREVNEVVGGNTSPMEEDFKKLQSRIIHRLDELIDTFSVLEVNKRAVASHPRNAVTPLLGILAEGFYYLANELEDVLIAESKQVIDNYFQRLIDTIGKSQYHLKLVPLLGNDGGIETSLEQLKKEVTHAVVAAAKIECDRYVRENPKFYEEHTFSIYQLRQTLLQACQGFDSTSMVEAQPAIRQLLKLDFQDKVKKTATNTFRQSVNNAIKTHLLPMATQKADEILQQYDVARANLEQTLAEEAKAVIDRNKQRQTEIEEKIKVYNEAIKGINNCLEAMQLYRKNLPLIKEPEFSFETMQLKSQDIPDVGS